MKKVIKGKCFADVEEMKQKTAEALKGIKIDKFKNCFEQWKKGSVGVLHQMENTLKVMEVSTCKNKYTIFINKFCFMVSSLIYTHICKYINLDIYLHIYVIFCQLKWYCLDINFL